MGGLPPLHIVLLAASPGLSGWGFAHCSYRLFDCWIACRRLDLQIHGALSCLAGQGVAAGVLRLAAGQLFPANWATVSFRGEGGAGTSDPPPPPPPPRRLSWQVWHERRHCRPCAQVYLSIPCLPRCRLDRCVGVPYCRFLLPSGLYGCYPTCGISRAPGRFAPMRGVYIAGGSASPPS